MTNWTTTPPTEPENWQVAYETDDEGKRTGRFKLLNERGEQDVLWPEVWLGERIQEPDNE